VHVSSRIGECRNFLAEPLGHSFLHFAPVTWSPISHAEHLNEYTTDHLASFHTARIDDLHCGQIIFLSAIGAISEMLSAEEGWVGTGLVRAAQLCGFSVRRRNSVDGDAVPGQINCPNDFHSLVHKMTSHGWVV
jgi:hypothetical protein